MARAIVVAGLAICKVDTGVSNALEDLGVSRNGVEITDNGYFLDVHTDEDGGDDGPPTDVQFLGQTATIRMELTKYDTAVRAKIDSRMYGGTSGTVGTVGTLMQGGSKTFRLLIHSTSEPYNFPVVVFREPIEINKGTKFSTLLVIGTAYRNGSSVLRNATTS